MRIFIKGGSWKNTEDEILKAAVMKYGKNQWARVASLLTRKSAKQCKARWYEWLDPSIKKTEWTKEEEEKLLHLAKVMPCQWRTIAPLVGRTAAQCLEHYEKLLDQAQDRDEGYDPEHDPRRLRPGEIDPMPENKPARPDALDMDEDEKEMLSEARARLANTKGKKAKRKARERQLEEARRLAGLQKKRELRAAGIELPTMERKTVRKRGIDYAKEIPFETRAPIGYFDVADEEEESKRRKLDPTYRHLHAERFEGKLRIHEEREQRRQDKKRQEENQRKSLQAHFDQVNKINDPDSEIKRRPLSMPVPQVGERELVTIAKMGITVAPQATPQSTPRTQDIVGQEAANLIVLQNAQTPLLGGVNEPLNERFKDFAGITPQRAAIQTPNILATPHLTANGAMTPATGIVAMPPQRTPLRDSLHLNDMDSEATPDLRPGSKLDRQQKRILMEQQRALQTALDRMPQPANDYELQLSVSEEQRAILELPEPAAPALEPDAVEVAAQREAQRKLKEEEERRSQTQAVQRGLPRPHQPPRFDPEIRDALDPEELLEKEMLTLVHYDAQANPRIPRKSKLPAPISPLDPPDPEAMTDAQRLLQRQLEEEYSRSSHFVRHRDGTLTIADLEKYCQECEEVDRDIIFLPNPPRYLLNKTATHAERLAAARHAFEVGRNHMTAETEKAAKLETRVQILTGGYLKRSEGLLQKVQEVYTSVEEAEVEYHCFLNLQQIEMLALKQRLEDWMADVSVQEKRERELQEEYKRLQHELEDVMEARRLEREARAAKKRKRGGIRPSELPPDEVSQPEAALVAPDSMQAPTAIPTLEEAPAPTLTLPPLPALPPLPTLPMPPTEVNVVPVPPPPLPPVPPPPSQMPEPGDGDHPMPTTAVPTPATLDISDVEEEDEDDLDEDL